ncbi:hypothetical protein, partial [Ruminococcus albus]|uniref:hypothetical protein n=1 Tax=Ruminococcus albus TaxID=1264 RepID=UPI001A9A3837
FFEEGLGVCALKQLISPVNMFFYSDVRIWLEGAAVATASFVLSAIGSRFPQIAFYFYIQDFLFIKVKAYNLFI